MEFVQLIQELRKCLVILQVFHTQLKKIHNKILN